MKGNVYTREKCPVCGENFKHINNRLICSEHNTEPHSFYIQVWSKQLHRPVNILGDQKERFRSYEDAQLLLSTLRSECKISADGDFDVTRYVKEKLRPFLFENQSKKWLDIKKQETEKGLKAPSYLKAIKVYIKKMQGFFKETDIRLIKKGEVERFYLSLNGAPHYISNILDCFKQILEDAKDNKVIQEVPKFPKIDVVEADQKTVDIKTQDMAIASIPNQMDRTFVLLTARLMLRPCEPRALWWEDIDFKHHWIFIKRHYSLNVIRPATKSKKIRRLPMDIEVENSLHALPRYVGSPFVFWKKRGYPFSESWARKVCKKITRKMGLNISLYDLTKRSSATEAADRVGIDSTQEFLGSGSRAIAQKYIQANPERLRKVLRKS